ncbi:MAG TPA: SulP family inorganic anion transporter [Gemmatimonadales bacterium]|nr:SulP family inorganic anion transporter [Gemmatimonadales bacterium]
MLLPKIATTLREYTREQFIADLGAGVVVGIVALPLAIAFGIASGGTPESGLFTAIVAGFLISALGGSRVQIGGPTGAFVVIVYGVIQQHGMDGLALATIMAGVLLIALGVARLGGAIKFIPYPVTTGFTSGIALIIFSSEVKDFLGLRMASVPSEFLAKWSAYAAALGTINWSAVLVAGGSLAILLLWPRVSRRIPAPFVALVAATAAVHLLHLPVETIGDRFGEIRARLPAPHLPTVTLDELRLLVPSAFTIALLAGIESLLSAVVADGMIGSKHRSNMELVAQGIANIASPLFGGLPATGAIARTATNVKNGGRTPVAGMVHALVLLLITLFLGRLAGLIPMAVLAAILVVVSYNMSEWRRFAAELRAPASDVLVLLSTFALTVLVDLTVAVEVGMVLAAFLFMKRMAEVTNVRLISREFQDANEEEMTGPNAIARRHVPEGVDVYEVDGPFFFGAAESFKQTIRSVAKKPKILIIRMRRVPVIDSTGLAALRDVAHQSRAERTVLILSDVHSQPVKALTESRLYDEIGGDNVCGNIDDALNRARILLGMPTEERPIFAQPTVARETEHGERRREGRL